MAIEIRNVNGNIMPPVSFNCMPGTWPLPTLRISNEGPGSVTTVKLTVANKDWSYSGQTNRNGQEVVSEKFVELHDGSGFVPVGGGLTSGLCISIGPILPGEYIDVPARMVIPANAQTRGKTSFIICGNAA